MSIRVAIAEDQRIVRELLAAILSKQNDFEVVGQASTGPEALELAFAQRPDVLLLDVGLPGLDGVQVARAVRARVPHVKVVALSIHSEPHVVRAMLDAGAAAYVLKSSALTELAVAILTVMKGKVYLSPEVAQAALGPRSVSAGRRPMRLGRRERQVLALVAEGRRTAEIAAQLGIAPATVEVHRRNIMRKLDIHSVAELTRFAVREGLITP